MADTLEELEPKPALSGWPMILGWLAMIIFAFHASTHMVGAGDTWVALACGRHFINHGVNTVEPFSANSHKAGPTEEEVKTWPGWAQSITETVGLDTVRYWHPTGWVNQNWLTHVIFYWLTHLSPFADAEELSFDTLVYWKIAIYILNVICIYYIGRVLGVNPALSAFFACFAMFVGRSFFDIRPAGFSNLMVAAYLLVLVLATHRNVLYIWLLVPIIAFWCNLHGGYIYAFIMFVPFVGFNFLTSFSKKRFASIGLKGVYHAVGAGAASFIAMIVFNPFHLTNLTHTFVISLSKNAERWRTVNEWHPAFEWKNPVGDEIPFLIMYIIAWFLLVTWLVVFIGCGSTIRDLPRRKQQSEGQYKHPRIDIALIVIAGLTIYMAIRSRRFIPIAAAAACPVLALFIDQMIRGVSAIGNYRKTNSLTVPAMSRQMQSVFAAAGLVAVLFFGTWWGLKFKRVYLDAWPTDPKLTSMFMRMTASDVKPFYACQFMRDNKLEGKMFNYWTEGGFIAWGQEPDPITGKTPLLLFMDGRAQAAYLQKTYDIWSNIMSGGRITAQLQAEARARKRRLGAADYKKIGVWIDEQLDSRGVWAVLMPAGQFSTPFLRGLEYDNNWNVVFYNNKQRLLLNTRKSRAKELFEGIDSGETIYRDEFNKNLIRAHYRILPRQTPEVKKEGLMAAFEAFNAHPSQAPMQKILYAGQFPELKAEVEKFCDDYFKSFVANQKQWLNEDGYHHKLAAALNAAGHLRKAANARKDQDEVNRYNSLIKKYRDDAGDIIRMKRW